MHPGYEICEADRYIERAQRIFAVQRWRTRSSNQQTAATAKSLLEVLTAMLKNVERCRATGGANSIFGRASRVPGRAV